MRNRTRRRWRKLLRLALAGVLILGVLEIGARAYWALRGISVWSTARQLHRAFYPELIPVENAPRDESGDTYDVLLLGGSVLHNDYGSIEHILRESLSRPGVNVRVFNVSMPGHTTLGSLYKYRHLSGIPFDLVVLYHGINEVRANNCPPQIFRDDYSHYSLHALINAWESKADHRWLVGPYTLRFVFTRAAERLGWTSYVPTHRPRTEDLKWGADVRSAVPFERNLRQIVELAKSRGQPLVLMTFAYYLPPDYSEELFNARQLDYRAHLLPVELWGAPENVSTALAMHNAVVRRLAAENPGCVFVDQDALLPHSANYFNDICHLTNEGCRQFVDNLLARLAQGAASPSGTD